MKICLAQIRFLIPLKISPTPPKWQKTSKITILGDFYHVSSFLTILGTIFESVMCIAEFLVKKHTKLKKKNAPKSQFQSGFTAQTR